MKQANSPAPPSIQSIGNENDWSSLFYRNARLNMLVIGLVVVSGLTSLSVLPRMEDPVIGQRAGLVATRLPGADAERVEVLVTEPIEDQLQDVEEIKRLTSESRPGISTIQIELREDVLETDEVWSAVRAKINDAIAFLPEAAQRPAFDEIDVRAYAMILALCWEREDPPNWAILRRLAKQLEDDMRAVPGTEVVDRFADPGEQITVDLDPVQAARLSLSAADVARAMSGADAKNAAGLLRAESRDVVIEMGNQFDEADRIGETLIQSGELGQMVRLDDIATVRRGVPDPLPRLAIINGRPAVSLGVLVRPNERIDLWRPKAQEALDRFAAQLPAGVSIDLPLDQSEYVEQRLSSLLFNLILGASAVALVVLFLMGWRSAMIVSLSLPLSAFSVLFALRILEIPIHQMSVTGMIIAMGLLIDNAIVAVDEVGTLMEKGHRRVDAVRRMVRHLAIPLAGSTATTALAFAPIAMMPGNSGEFVGSIAISVIIAITASLFFALTIIPVMAARFLRPAIGSQTPTRWKRLWEQGFTSSWLLLRYRAVLTWLLAKPIRGLASGLVLPVFGFAIASRLPEQFFPPADRDQFHIQLELPVDASITATQRAAAKLTEMVTKSGAVKVSWYFGESAPMFYYNVINNRRGVPNFANAIIQMDSAEEISESLRDFQKRADSLVPEGRVLFRQLEQGPPFAAPIEIRLFGPDLHRLAELGDQVRVALAGAPDVIHTKSPLNETLPTLRMNVREADARMAGLLPADVSSQLFGMLEGVEAGSILEDTEQLPVVVRVGKERRKHLASVSALELNVGSTRLPIESVADVELTPEIAVVPHMNRRRMNLVSGYITAGTLPSVSLLEFEKRLEESNFVLPPGYFMEYGGEASQRDDAVGNLMASVGVLGLLMVAVLVLSFGSFRLAGLILVVAACSGGLGMIGLWAGGYPFGFMAIIGIMGLIGVAINDSIVVLASLQQQTREGDTSLGSTVETVIGCSRHVTATTLTTIAGFTPLIIDGGQFWPPLAISIAGGVSGATLLALFFVPAAYRWIVPAGPECEESRPGMSVTTPNPKPEMAVA